MVTTRGGSNSSDKSQNTPSSSNPKQRVKHIAKKKSKMTKQGNKKDQEVITDAVPLRMVPDGVTVVHPEVVPEFMNPNQNQLNKDAEGIAFSTQGSSSGSGNSNDEPSVTPVFNSTLHTVVEECVDTMLGGENVNAGGNESEVVVNEEQIAATLSNLRRQGLIGECVNTEFVESEVETGVSTSQDVNATERECVNPADVEGLKNMDSDKEKEKGGDIFDDLEQLEVEMPQNINTEMDDDLQNETEVPADVHTGEHIADPTTEMDVPSDVNAVPQSGGFQIPTHLKDNAEKAVADLLQAFANIENMDKENPELIKNTSELEKPKKRKREIQRKKNQDESISGVKESATETVKEKIVEDSIQKKKSRKGKKIADDEPILIRKGKKETAPAPPVAPTVEDSWNPETDDDAEEDVVQIIQQRKTSGSSKQTGKLRLNETRVRLKGKRIAQGIPDAPTTNVKLSSMDAKARWKFVCARRIAPEKDISEATQKNEDIMKVIRSSGVMTTVATVGAYWPQLVREFICNIRDDIDNPESKHFEQVTLRKIKFDFSPDVINAHLNTSHKGTTGEECDLDDVAEELTGRTVLSWPTGQLSSVKLSMKYAILHKVCIINLAPTSHTAHVSEGLARAMYVIGKGEVFDYGQFMWNVIVSHAKSHAKLKPIAYPRLICALLLAQAPQILTTADIQGPDPGFITISKSLLGGSHVADIELGSSSQQAAPKKKIVAGAQGESIQILQAELKFLDDSIQRSLARKSVVEATIAAMTSADPADEDVPSVEDSDDGDMGTDGP